MLREQEFRVETAHEYKYFGPPGTGKTTRLATVTIPRAVAKFGPDRVMVSSFTRAAAFEIAHKKSIQTGETINVNPQHVGTFHAICFRAFKHPEMAESSKNIRLWNENNPGLTISGGAGDVEDALTTDGAGSSDGDRLLNKVNILRGRLVNEGLWPADAKYFMAKWRDFKASIDAMDFTDLIERGVDELPIAPGNPRASVCDEVQDYTPLMLKLARSWGQHQDFFILCGDDDQTIYRFTGADPRAFLEPDVPQDHKVILKQSYRVPRAVLERAMKVIMRVKRREPKVYEPRKDENDAIVEGSVVDAGGCHYKNPVDWVQKVIDRAAEGRSVMVLGSCSYMIDPVKNVLREAGVPFANRYRPQRGDWNPLARSSDKVSASDLLVNFLSRGDDGAYWTVPQLVRWAKYLRVRNGGLVFKKGKKALAYLEDLVKNDPGRPELYTTRELLADIIEEDCLERALDRDTAWLKETLVGTRQKSIEYPIKVYRNHGEEAIRKSPGITIGTIHSVKGGEADSVFLFPDISFQAQKEIDDDQAKGDAVDSANRLFYVGMTRAREELIIMDPAMPKQKRSTFYVEI